VFVPTRETINSGESIKNKIESWWRPPKFYYHLRDGGYVKGLESHLNHDYFLHLDIRNFFGCINKSRVTRCLKKYWAYDQARQIASESTVKNPDKKMQAITFSLLGLCSLQLLHRFAYSKVSLEVIC
jgi:hypothetical protein